MHEGPTAIALELCGKHTPESHAQDRSKFLTAKMKGVIASKVKENPLKLATDIRREIATHSPGKQIPVSLQASVTRAVRRERVFTNSSRLYGIPLDTTYGSLERFCGTPFLPTLLQRHNESSEVEDHLCLYRPFVIAYGIDSDVQSVSGSPGIFMAVSSMWMLLNIG